MEDQVTYPIITGMLGAPKVKAIRGFSDFGYSYVYIIFEDGTDIYWARSRTLEYLSKITPLLPEDVRTELGPDATAVGWVFQYALVDTTGKHSLADLRSYQDWYLRYYLQSVPGVAEVAPIGGFVRQYQVTVDPNKLAGYGISTEMVMEKIRKNNNDVGGRLVEFSQRVNTWFAEEDTRKLRKTSKKLRSGQTRRQERRSAFAISVRSLLDLTCEGALLTLMEKEMRSAELS